MDGCPRRREVNQEQKKLTEQNKKLLNCDFPWLWGVRSFWNLSSDKIRVMNAEQTINAFTTTGFFGLPLSDLPGSSKNIFVYYKNKDKFGTLRIESGGEKELCWANRILETVPQDYIILNIVINGPDIVTVYRIKRKGVTFRGILTRIVS